MLYLLLECHIQNFRVAQTHILDPDELSDASDSIQYALDEVHDHVETLKSIFKQQKLEEKQQLNTFTHGLDELDPKIICNYPLDTSIIDYATCESTSSTIDLPSSFVTSDSSDFEHLQAIAGTWNGYIYYLHTPQKGTIEMTIVLSEVKGNEIELNASGISDDTKFTLSGTCKLGKDPNFLAVSLTRVLSGNHCNESCNGKLDWKEGAITGTAGFEYNDSDSDSGSGSDSSENGSSDSKEKDIPLDFFLRRPPPKYLRFRPAPLTFTENKARAL
ncbi:hypothetical protein M422DRAFT_64240 [Sphaerobolus stellatus SS14]|nr:hypothetical protein M422DRAFT_64240 [Sphaerobolus stellatus SS14]